MDQLSEIKNIQINNAEILQKLEPVCDIGCGCQGKVIKVINKDLFAYKIMNFINENISIQHQFLNEYELINSLEHPNILKTLAIYISNGVTPLSLINEFVPINLDNAIKNKLLSKVHISFAIYPIVEGMKYNRFKRIIHRNLKPTNILIDEYDTIKISDFGISKLYTVGEQLAIENVGNPKFMSPELLNEEDYDEKVDVYSFGVIVLALLNEGNIQSIKVRDIILGKRIEIESSFTQLSNQLIESCFSFDPKISTFFQCHFKCST